MVYEYANQLVIRRHQVVVVHPRRLPNWAPSSPTNPYRRIRRKGGYLRKLFFRPRIDWQPIDPRVQMLYVAEPEARYVPDADAVFATAWPTAELVSEYPCSKGQKFYLAQGYELWEGPKERVDATWLAPLFKVVVSKWLYEKGIELGVLKQQMVHIPNGINHALFQLLQPVAERPKRIAMMYSSGEWKGAVDGVEALGIAKNEFPPLQAILFGVAKRPPWLPQWIQYIQDPPPRILIEQIYNKSSIYLCPSWTEGWGLPPAEALACGCALVLTASGGVSDYAEHGVTALLSATKEPSYLASNIVRLLKDEELRIRLAKEGHQRIQEFTWERSTDLLEQVLT